MFCNPQSFNKYLPVQLSLMSHHFFLSECGQLLTKLIGKGKTKSNVTQKVLIKINNQMLD